jgi:integrase
MARDGEGIYQRSGIWCFRYKDDLRGIWREKSTGVRKRGAARRIKRQFLDDLEQGNLPAETAAWSLEQAGRHWLEVRAATKREKTASVERRLLRQVRKVLGDGRVLRTISAADLEAYQVTRRRSVGPRTVNLELFCLRQLLKRAGLWSRFREHYTALPVPRGSVGRVLTEAEARRLAEVAGSHPGWDVALYATVLAYSTGCRGGEIKQLRVGDIVLDGPDPRINIRREGTKTNAGARPVPLNGVAMWAATRLMERARMLGATDPARHHLLPLDPLDHQRSWSSAWRSLRQAAGLAGLRFHDLRHTFITMAAENGVPLAVTKALVGHMGVEMTERYTHIQTEALQRAVQALEAANREAFGALLPAPADGDTCRRPSLRRDSYRALKRGEWKTGKGMASEKFRFADKGDGRA